MFTGIIECLGLVKEIASAGGNKSFWIQSPISQELRVDQSLAHNGVCLTIEDIREGWHKVTAVQETLKKTNLEQWIAGTQVNLERSLLPSNRVDGHFVQGHVDTVGSCIGIRDRAGSHELDIKFPKKFAPLVIEKGSISVNGVSLTAFEVGKNSFRVAIIPYTFSHTNLQNLKENDTVNLEFDLLGKYILRKLSLEK